jgi:hypothetical protein
VPNKNQLTISVSDTNYEETKRVDFVPVINSNVYQSGSIRILNGLHVISAAANANTNSGYTISASGYVYENANANYAPMYGFMNEIGGYYPNGRG